MVAIVVRLDHRFSSFALSRFIRTFSTFLGALWHVISSVVALTFGLFFLLRTLIALLSPSFDLSLSSNWSLFMLKDLFFRFILLYFLLVDYVAQR